MDNFWAALVPGVAIVSLMPVLRRLRRGLAGTALVAAWNWVAAVWLSWLVAALLSLIPATAGKTADMAWYIAAVLALTPPIAVLGARRPTSRVWDLFVLLPLVLVLAWPILPALDAAGSGPFSLEEPLVAGYALVLVMGAGNYLALRYSLPALLWGAGLLLVVLPLCPATAGWSPGAAGGRCWGAICLAAAGWTAAWLARGRRSSPACGARPALDGVWHDFRDLFGIVWSRRVQERFNADARRNGLPMRLGFDGLQRADGGPPDANLHAPSLAAAEQSLRWLLQKFVDPEWINARIAGG